MDVSICASASELHQIVSLAGGALALNLAYVNLERFRYAKAIRNQSKDVLDKVERAEQGDLTKARSYRQLKVLVTFPHPKKNGDDPTEGVGRSILLTRTVHEWLFVKPVDIIICSIFVMLSVVALALGSGHPIGVLEWTCTVFDVRIFDKEHIDTSFWILAAGLIVPMIFLTVGAYIQWKCGELADRIEGDFGHLLQQEVPDARLRDEPEGDE